MRKLRLLVLFAIVLGSTTVSAKEFCPDPATQVPFNKVMNPAFSKTYEACPVTTTVEFVTAGAPPGVPLPSKIKKMVVIQGVHPGDARHSSFLEGEVIGIPKQFADQVFALSKGKKIRLQGKRYNSLMMKFMRVNAPKYFFVATSMEVLN